MAPFVRDRLSFMSTQTSAIAVTFLVGVALMGVAGSCLVRCADAIAECSGLSRTWVGLLGVATITSLPELATGLSAVTLAESPDICQ